MKSDYHLHSNHSPDSITPMDVYCDKAIELGLDELCFTEHLDHDMVYTYSARTTFTFEDYLADIRRLQEKYQGRLTVKAGIEFGIQRHTIQAHQKDYETYPLDFILLSSHEIDNQEYWRHDYQKGKTQLEYNRGYYENLLQIVKAYDGYSVLAHMDVMKRYDQNGILDDELVIDLVEKILKVIIKKGKGLEVNTSSIRYGMKDLTPSKRILSLYRELGGTILSLGSDAHQVLHLAEHMDFVRSELRELGFEEYCTFEKMVPQFHAL